MAHEYIDFKYNWSQDHQEGDLNERRTKQHLKAFIRGYGSTTENIVIDFVNNTTSTIEQYDSIQQAWNKLDEGQKIMIDDFRALVSKGSINAQSSTFCHDWYRNVIADKYHNLIEEYEREIGSEIEEIDGINVIDKKAEFAKQAEIEISKKIKSTDNSPVWSIESDDY